MKPTIKYLFISLFIIISCNSIFAQGQIKGTITDSTSQSLLIGANVYLMGTSLGASTDIEGEYLISNIPVDTYTVKVSYIGYETKNFDVEVFDNKTTLLDVQLIPEVLEGEVVVITGQALGQASAINQQLTSNTITNVISEEKIQELPDANVAETIGRLPGVSITRSGGEANKIIVRGMSDTYAYVTLDGVKVPTTDALERGTDLSLISQNNLAGIELYKALTPDMEADAIAGSVNLLTRKASSEGIIRAVLRGGYNELMQSAQQYSLSFRYSERFFDELLGLQLSGNFEKKIRSNELIDLDYDQNILNQTSYFINNFSVRFTDEDRIRRGGNLILDINTPDDGVIKLNTVYNYTKRDFIEHQRNYPNGGGTAQTGGVTYDYRDREQEINFFTSSLTGDNYLLGLDLTWGLAFAQSKTVHPFDYHMFFTEPSINDSVNNVYAGMGNPPQIKDNPEQLIDYAYNNFDAATLSEAFYRTQDNLDKNIEAYLNLSKDYNISSQLSGVIKIGGRYRTKDRENNTTQTYAPYYLGNWKGYEKLADGTIVPKDLSGTYFEPFYLRYLENPQFIGLPFVESLDDIPKSRVINDLYSLYPLINRDKLRQWYDLNKNGISPNGAIPEYYNDPAVANEYYDITESVGAGYIMNTLNIGQSIVFIAGVRVEAEDNDYKNKYSTIRFASFPASAVVPRDTTAHYSETVWLPNFQLLYKATDFLNIRLAAYKALARPDFNMRLNTYFAWRGATVGSNQQLYRGNPNLKTAKAWNFEINTSFYGNKIGLISLSVFYKEIEDMYHMLNQINTSGSALLIDLGLGPQNLQPGSYQLTVPYNSPDPSKVWGLEFEQQTNFTFLPGLLQNIVLSYNLSFIRSETTIIGVTTDTTYVTVPGFPVPIPEYSERPITMKQELENQPKFFGNLSLGYDIGGFSGRIGVFHQSDYFSSFSPTGRSDRIIGAYTRLDLALKYQAWEFLTFLLNVSNLTNIDEDDLIDNKPNGYTLLNTRERYGITMDFGVRVDL
jgi:TonB-dependent receptor